MVVEARTRKHVVSDLPVQTPVAVPPPPSSDEIQVLYQWQAEATIVRSTMDGENVRYLYQETMRLLLDQVSEGQTFSVKTIQTSKFLGPNEFYLALGWLKVLGLVRKVSGGYVIDSVEAVRRTWNEIVTKDVRL